MKALVIYCNEDLRFNERHSLNSCVSELEFGVQLEDNEVAVTIEEGGELNTVYVNKTNAVDIINHLVEVFELQPSDIGV